MFAHAPSRAGPCRPVSPATPPQTQRIAFAPLFGPVWQRGGPDASGIPLETGYPHWRSSRSRTAAERSRNPSVPPRDALGSPESQRFFGFGRLGLQLKPQPQKVFLRGRNLLRWRTLALSCADTPRTQETSHVLDTELPLLEGVVCLR